MIEFLDTLSDEDYRRGTTTPEITLETITRVLESICCDEDLQPYKDLGDGLYELPGNVICNKSGLYEYLKELKSIK